MFRQSKYPASHADRRVFLGGASSWACFLKGIRINTERECGLNGLDRSPQRKCPPKGQPNVHEVIALGIAITLSAMIPACYMDDRYSLGEVSEAVHLQQPLTGGSPQAESWVQRAGGGKRKFLTQPVDALDTFFPLVALPLL